MSDGFKFCILTELMKRKKWDLQQVADNIGDDLQRLKSVMNGNEDLGKTANLAIAAIMHNLPTIDQSK